MKRSIEAFIRKDLKRKIVLLTGPRQTGKTTLAKMLAKGFDYFNGEKWNLYFLEKKDGREIDSLITKNEKPALMLEVKWSDAERSPNFSFFEKYLAGMKKIQVVKELKREETYPDSVEIRAAQNWLSEMRLEG